MECVVSTFVSTGISVFGRRDLRIKMKSENALTAEDQPPAVTDHARLRYIERVSGSEPHPTSRIQSAFRRGREAIVNGHDARIDPDTGAALIFDGGAIVTVLHPSDQQLEQVGGR